MALALLGLGPIDGSTINLAQDLRTASAFAADFDANQWVDGADFSIWQAGYAANRGATKAHGDATHDGKVNGRDILAWQREHGSSLTEGINAVPEPDCAVLVLTVIAFLRSRESSR